GVGRIFAPLAAFADGPFPEHYEPIESPIDNPLHPAQTHNPVVKRFKTPDDKYATPKDGYTVICTTYRLTELYHYWTKNNPTNGLSNRHSHPPGISGHHRGRGQGCEDAGKSDDAYGI